MKLTRCILVIDDEEIFLKMVANALNHDGYRVVLAENATKGLQVLESEDVDLIILDLKLPDIDGTEVARWVRVENDVPILVLSGVSEVESRVKALDAGADDYLVKPFDPNELNARVRSLLRRYDMGSHVESEETLRHGDWSVDVANAELTNDVDAQISLTERELLILTALMQRPGTIVSRDELTRQAAGRGWQSADRSLDVHVSHLRKKIETVTSGTSHPIRTVRNRGFMYDPDAV